MGELPRRRGTYRLAVYGSMMDPPHVGHLAVVTAVHAAGYDRVLVVPAGLPPHRAAPRVSPRARLTMAVRAFADLDHVVVSDSEVERSEHGEVGFMVDTLEELVELPAQLGYDELQVELGLVVGGDQLAVLKDWHRLERILELATIVVVARPDQSAAEQLEAAAARLRGAGARLRQVDMPPVAVSSTQVRAMAATGDRAALARLVPPQVLDDVVRLYAG